MSLIHQIRTGKISSDEAKEKIAHLNESVAQEASKLNHPKETSPQTEKLNETEERTPPRFSKTSPPLSHVSQMEVVPAQIPVISPADKKAPAAPVPETIARSFAQTGITVTPDQVRQLLPLVPAKKANLLRGVTILGQIIWQNFLISKSEDAEGDDEITVQADASAHIVARLHKHRSKR